ncbi:MAG: hypothetical protein BWY73_00011 [candidate division TA06 bacterium ADurb.Bin417]|uniref:Beta-galactosidase trimerization domain protein n=1 Tax=candidate division TA06 bacterium ADurb.Bin417 TaxID=1852828 RepID=A0A1V5ML70_UNCT6|nr:MAG: hypothetical protein BWY73_00011 [candidate division TA06 bacterium ADurb.Bin417]
MWKNKLKITAAALLMAAELAAGGLAGADEPGLLFGPTVTLRQNADGVRTLEDLKAVDGNFLLAFQQDLGENFMKLCEAAGVTVYLNSVGRPALRPGADPGDYYQHSIFGAFGRDWREFLLRNAGRQDLHGLCCVPDEFTWHNAQLQYTLSIRPPRDWPFYPSDETIGRRFKQETGLELPRFGHSRVLDGRDPAQRSYAAIRYRWTAEVLKEWSDQIRSVNPRLKVGAVLTTLPAYGLERYPSGIAWDRLGESGALDLAVVTAFGTGHDYRGLDTHYLISETAATLAAAFGPAVKTGVAICLYSQNVESDTQTLIRSIGGLYLPTPLRPVDIYGTHIASAFHGARVFSAYDGRYVFPSWASTFSAEKQAALKSGYDYLRRIDSYLVSGKAPSEIVVLLSRAGEDYYQLDNARSGRGAVDDGSAGIWEVGGWAQPANFYAWQGNYNQESSRGFRAQAGTLRYLMKRGHLFRVRYLDQSGRLDLAGARTVILPFPYSLPAAALEKIEAAVNAGANLVIMNQLGELDEQGRPAPGGAALARLIPVQKGDEVEFGGLAFLAAPPSEARYSEKGGFFAPALKPGPGTEAAATDQAGNVLVARRRLGQGWVYFTAGLTPDQARDEASYRVMDRLVGLAFQSGSADPLPVAALNDIEAGFRRLGDGAYLGVINWSRRPQKAVYRLPEDLARARRWQPLNLDTSSTTGVTVDEKGQVTFELEPYSVKGVIFHNSPD